MSIVKQKGVSTAAHKSNLEKYLGDGEKVLGRDGYNLFDLDNWAEEMKSTIEAYGHDTPPLPGTKDNETFIHLVYAANPDECECNGGKLTPDEFMQMNREYLETVFPDQECYSVMHLEKNKETGLERYAIHTIINRTNLLTGKRYRSVCINAQGLETSNPKANKFWHAKVCQEIDRKHGLHVVEPGRNSKLQARSKDITPYEKALHSRGKTTWKDELRFVIHEAKTLVTDLPGLVVELANRGVECNTKRAAGEISYKSFGHNWIRGSRLSGGTEREVLEQYFNNRAAKSQAEAKTTAMEEQAQMRAEQADKIKRAAASILRSIEEERTAEETTEKPPIEHPLIKEQSIEDTPIPMSDELTARLAAIAELGKVEEEVKPLQPEPRIQERKKTNNAVAVLQEKKVDSVKLVSIEEFDIAYENKLITEQTLSEFQKEIAIVESECRQLADIDVSLTGAQANLKIAKEACEKIKPGFTHRAEKKDAQAIADSAQVKVDGLLARRKLYAGAGEELKTLTDSLEYLQALDEQAQAASIYLKTIERIPAAERKEFLAAYNNYRNEQGNQPLSPREQIAVIGQNQTQLKKVQEQARAARNIDRKNGDLSV